MAVYYRFYDTKENRYLHTGYNGTLPEVRDELIDFLDETDGQYIFKDIGIRDICEFTGYLRLERRLGLPFDPHPEDIEPLDTQDRFSLLK